MRKAIRSKKDQQQPVQSLVLSPLVHDIFPPHVFFSCIAGLVRDLVGQQLE